MSECNHPKQYQYTAYIGGITKCALCGIDKFKSEISSLLAGYKETGNLELLLIELKSLGE